MSGIGKPEESAHPHSKAKGSSVSDSDSDSDERRSRGEEVTMEDTRKWGTRVMGPPAVPTTNPDNQQAALWRKAAAAEDYFRPQPYVVSSPVVAGDRHSPFESVCHMFNSWSNRAENLARNVWHNLKTAPSVSEAAWGKLNVTAKAIAEGGFEPFYNHVFEAGPEERLKKTYACYLSTTTGPVAGTLFLSSSKVAFCSDRPLSLRAPSGQEAWSYYKVALPLEKIAAVNPVVMRENTQERYIQIVTVDGHDFWFMGFVNFEKATHNLLDALKF